LSPPTGGGAPPIGGGIFAGTGKPIPTQAVAEVSKKWPAGNVDVRMGNYMCQAQQKWSIEPVSGTGYFGLPYFKITVAGTDRTLAASADAELVVLPDFTAAPEQLWRFDELADGSWRIMPKAIPNLKQPLALSAVGGSFATLAIFDSRSEKLRWLLKTP